MALGHTLERGLAGYAWTHSERAHAGGTGMVRAGYSQGCLWTQTILHSNRTHSARHERGTKRGMSAALSAA